MKSITHSQAGRTGGLFLALLILAGCGKPEGDQSVTATPPKPVEAATQLQKAFVTANPEIKSTADTASAAMEAANYEQAIQSLQVIKARQNLTIEQGMAVYNSERSLEARLIAAMEAGDPNAKRAYEMLKKTRRN